MISGPLKGVPALSTVILPVVTFTVAVPAPRVRTPPMSRLPACQELRSDELEHRVPGGPDVPEAVI